MVPECWATLSLKIRVLYKTSNLYIPLKGIRIRLLANLCVEGDLPSRIKIFLPLFREGFLCSSHWALLGVSELAKGVGSFSTLSDMPLSIVT